MKTTLFAQVLLSLFLWKSAEALPEGSKPLTQNSNPNTGTVSLLGQLYPQNCQDTRSNWSKSQDPWAKVTLADSLTLYHNVWNHEKLQSPSSNSILCQKFSGTTTSWQVDFNFIPVPQSSNQVKSYTNVVWQGTTQSIQDLKVFKSAWNWTLSNPSQNLVMDVSYDLFTSDSLHCNSQDCAKTEIMVWLAAIGGALPASKTNKPVGQVEIKGSGGLYKFDVWDGVVANKQVLSLIPPNQKQYNKFDVNFKDVLRKLKPFGFQDQYLVNIGAGLEVFQGKGKLSNSYSLHLQDNKAVK